ncbi:unnamed protein product [Diplocarpon coronariae]
MTPKTRGLDGLPTELLLGVFGCLDSTSDLLTLYRLTRRLHNVLLPLIFEKHLARVGGAEGDNNLQHALIKIFFYAVARNQQMETQPITYLHFALLMDAPCVSSHLIKYGASILESPAPSTYPDLTTLFLALGRYRVSTSLELNTALRIACSYGLSNTVRFLLDRGADANSVSKYGLSPLHTTLARRERWREFDALHTFLYPLVPSDEHPRVWESMVTAVVAELLKYGADATCRTSNSRAHKCGHRCWKSISCENSGQTALHLAAGSGFFLAAHKILSSEEGAGNRRQMLEGGDGGGNTPLYCALAQGQGEVAAYLLESLGERNPIVNTTTRSTALHIACRFALSGVVFRLLNNGADVDAVDFYGQTSLHELLKQTLPGRQEAVLETMHNLASFGANPDINTGTGDLTPRQVGATHPFVEVRTLLEAVELRICVNARGGLSIVGGKGIWDTTRAVSVREERERERIAREEEIYRMNERKLESDGPEAQRKHMSRGKNKHQRNENAGREARPAARRGKSSTTDGRKVETAGVVGAPPQIQKPTEHQSRGPRANKEHATDANQTAPVASMPGARASKQQKPSESGWAARAEPKQSPSSRPRPALMAKSENEQLRQQQVPRPNATQTPTIASRAAFAAPHDVVFQGHVFWDLEAQKKDIESRMPKIKSRGGLERSRGENLETWHRRGFVFPSICRERGGLRRVVIVDAGGWSHPLQSIRDSMYHTAAAGADPHGENNDIEPRRRDALSVFPWQISPRHDSDRTTRRAPKSPKHMNVVNGLTGCCEQASSPSRVPRRPDELSRGRRHTPEDPRAVLRPSELFPTTALGAAAYGDGKADTAAQERPGSFRRAPVREQPLHERDVQLGCTSHQSRCVRCAEARAAQRGRVGREVPARNGYCTLLRRATDIRELDSGASFPGGEKKEKKKRRKEEEEKKKRRREEEEKKRERAVSPSSDVMRSPSGIGAQRSEYRIRDTQTENRRPGLTEAANIRVDEPRPDASKAGQKCDVQQTAKVDILGHERRVNSRYLRFGDVVKIRCERVLATVEPATTRDEHPDCRNITQTRCETLLATLEPETAVTRNDKKLRCATEYKDPSPRRLSFDIPCMQLIGSSIFGGVTDAFEKADGNVGWEKRYEAPQAAAGSIIAVTKTAKCNKTGMGLSPRFESPTYQHTFAGLANFWFLAYE